MERRRFFCGRPRPSVDVFVKEGLPHRRIEDHLRLGSALGEAIARSDRKVILIASGALSHTFWPLRELRDHVVKNAENVGQRFPEEARKMHYGEAEHRSIYGIASPQDAEALHEEGIAFSALPVLPEDRN